MEILMVKIALIGWYGTETIGDRAILAGLFHLFSEAYDDFEIMLGSIYPFFTERTLLEDRAFLELCSGKREHSVSIFNSLTIPELNAAIEKCDILAVGGGPFFDSYCMFMLEYAFKLAKKKGKKTMVLGCGVGPLNKKLFQRTMISVVNHSDVCVFRDERSQIQYNQISGKKKDTLVSIDPAVFAVGVFKRCYSDIPIEKDLLTVNVRKFPSVYKHQSFYSEEEIDLRVQKLVTTIQRETNLKLQMVPMHYFEIGLDDRSLMNQWKHSGLMNISRVQNEPLNMVQTMQVFAGSALCIGMRFHAVLMQTMLCGKNIILDYTDPEKGKIGGFLNQMKAMDHYTGMYMNLQQNRMENMDYDLEPFQIPDGVVEEYRSIYVKALSAAVSRIGV
jgi:polysaccharide pyruvyl transferase WcaK-like protein